MLLFSKQILWIAKEIFVRDAGSEIEKWRSALVKVSVCFLTCPIPNVIFTFAPLGVVLGCMKTPNGTRYFKTKASFVLIYRYYILIPYVESTDENSRLK